MDPILDELSLEPAPEPSVALRVDTLAATLKALDQLGAPRVLRSVRDAADRELADGKGLRYWCFATPKGRDGGRLVATRLAQQPFIDGPDGLFAAFENDRVLEPTVAGRLGMGAGLAALTDGALVALGAEPKPASNRLMVVLSSLDDDELKTETIEVERFLDVADVNKHAASLIERIEHSVGDGRELVRRFDELYPHLRLGPRAREQLAELRRNDRLFQVVFRHLRALEECSRAWRQGSLFEPEVPHSAESNATLAHPDFGPLRDLPVPAGYPNERFSYHTKMKGSPPPRLYYRKPDGTLPTLVAYVGPHLPTVNDPT